jgi:hypothetical protein
MESFIVKIGKISMVSELDFFLTRHPVERRSVGRTPRPPTVTVLVVIPKARPYAYIVYI